MRGTTRSHTRTGGSLSRQAGRTRVGSTTLELVFAIAVLLVGLLGYSRSLVGSVELGQKNRDTAVATEAARAAIEGFYGTAFDDVFSSFNADPTDDPGGIGTAPGNTFTVQGLDLRFNDADGMHGEIFFPINAGALREDLNDDSLGTPRDLNLDGAVDAADHAGDYRLLPVLVRVEWRSGERNRQIEVRTLLAQR